jgi:hypothetical protein
MFCRVKYNNLGQLFGFILFLIFLSLSSRNYFKRCQKADKVKFPEDFDKKIYDVNIEANGPQNEGKNKRKIYDYEIPLEKLEKILKPYEYKPEKKKGDDPEIFDLRKPKKSEDGKSSGGKENETLIDNDGKSSDGRENESLIDKDKESLIDKDKESSSGKDKTSSSGKGGKKKKRNIKNQKKGEKFKKLNSKSEMISKKQEMIDESEKSEENDDNISNENETNANEDNYNNINNEKEKDLFKVTKNKEEKENKEKKEEEKKEEEIKKEELIEEEKKEGDSIKKEKEEENLIDLNNKDKKSVDDDEQKGKDLIDDTKSVITNNIINNNGENKNEKDKESIKIDVKEENSRDISENPKENQTGYDEDSKNNNFSFNITVHSGDISSQNSQKKINKSNSDKANPPIKDNRNERPLGPSSEREMNNASQNDNQAQNNVNIDERNTPCCKTYKDYIYTINKDLEKNDKCCKCCSCCDDDAKYNCWDIFWAKTISENTLLFVCFCSKYDKNGYFIRLAVLILYIGWYMCFNLLTEFNSSDLHFLLKKDYIDENSGTKFSNWLINAILPYLFVYLVIRYFRRAISLREFYLEEKERIEYIIITYKNKKEERTTKLHTERTRIKKFKNNLINNVKIVVTIGFIILGYNAYLSYCFFGIYRNSFWCIVVNVLSSIGSSIIISIIINIIELIANCNFKKILFILYMPCCWACYWILNKIFNKREEFNDLNEDDDLEESKNDMINNQTRNREENNNNQ